VLQVAHSLDVHGNTESIIFNSQAENLSVFFSEMLYVLQMG